MKYPTTRKTPDRGTLVCTDCGVEAPRTGPIQRYCKPCSEIRDLARKKRYQKDKGQKAYQETRTQFGVRGVVLNAPQRLDIVTSTPLMPTMAWYKRVEIPFSWAGSKNHIFANTSRGHVFMRDEARGMRDHLTEVIAKSMSGIQFAQNKLWIDIYVQKPVARGDAVNFVDMVCDAAKDGILLDDKWFCIRSVDWQIVKADPKLFVGFGQDSLLDVQACSSCGRLLTFENFQRNRARANGIGLNCRDCQATRPRSLKRTRSQEKLSIELGQGIFG